MGLFYGTKQKVPLGLTFPEKRFELSLLRSALRKLADNVETQQLESCRLPRSAVFAHYRATMRLQLLRLDIVSVTKRQLKYYLNQPLRFCKVFSN